MRLNSKLTWGLAWAGLAVIVAVPSADYLTGSRADSAAVLTSDTDPVKTASIETVKGPAAIELAPSVTSVKTGTTAPGFTVVPVKVGSPAPVTAPLVAPEPSTTEVASLSPEPKAAPFPAPVSARPRLPPPQESETIVIPEDVSPESDSAIILPPADIPEEPYASDPESLRDYLVSRGLIDGDPADSTATVTYLDSESDYDPDGFYLSDGPNAESRPTRRTRLDLFTGSNGEWEFNLF
ncbi:MAG: hypothetical protein ABL866_10245 [Devosia sp.]